VFAVFPFQILHFSTTARSLTFGWMKRPAEERSVDAFAVLVRAVSLAVSFSRHSVNLRVRCYDTDAQDLA